MNIEAEVTPTAAADDARPAEAAETNTLEAAIDADLEAATDGSDEDANPDDDGEEIEFEGGKYRIPAALKGAFLKDADYRQKTSSVKREREAVAEYAATVREDFELQATARGVEQRIAQLESADLSGLTHDQVLELKDEYRDLKDARRELTAGINQRQQERQQAAARETDNHYAQSIAQAEKDIPDFKTIKGDLEALAAKHGNGPDAIKHASAGDWQLLHLANIGAKFLERQGKAATIRAAASAQPASEIRGRSPAIKPLDDRAATDDWMKARTAQAQRG